MEIVGYAKRGSKDMVIFRDDRGGSNQLTGSTTEKRMKMK